MSWWGHRAAEGDAESMFLYGHCLLTQGPNQNETKALEFFQEAAAMNHVESLLFMGRYIVSVGERTGSKDEARAYDYFNKAAAQGSSKGMFFVALSLMQGEGVSQDLRKAAETFSRVASFNDEFHDEALAHLGCCYAKGDDNLPRDFKKAVELFKVSARSDNTLAQYMLGACYVNKTGVEFDLNNAMHLLKLASLKGHKEANRLLTQLIDLYNIK
jgi:TPR repeat protein